MNLNQAQALEAIEKYLGTIRKEQDLDGGFSHQSWLAEAFSFSAIEYKTTFFAANILAGLNTAMEAAPELLSKLPEIIEIRASVAQFLLAQRSEHWSFSYWMRNSDEAKTMPYPDDLDDTFMALKALHGYDASLIDGTVMACIAKMLTALEVEPGGPYRTWLVKSNGGNGETQWRDVDLVVNSNVANFLLRLDICLPKIEELIERKIQNKELNSPYYPSIIPVIYFLSQNYQGDGKSVLIEMLLEREATNRLECAMIVSALINLDCPREKISQRYIDALVQGDGCGVYAFCMDPAHDSHPCYSGSVALTAAFCVEALAKLLIEQEKITALRSLVEPLSSGSEAVVLKIKKMAATRCSPLPKYLKELALNEVDAISDANIVMVPYMMHEAIDRPDEVSFALLDELALANLYGWIAYTIYDDFLDNEGKPLLLNVANFFLRELSSQYAKLGKIILGLYAEYFRIMNVIDNANIREQKSIDVGDLDRLADRSLGHALPALGVLLAAGYAPDSPEATAAHSFFKNYLIARQLHDDAHDWKEDFLRGQINSVGSRLMKISGESGRSRESSSESLAKFIPALQKLFWREVVSDVVADIIFFLDRARSATATFKNPAPFLELLDRLQSAADRTLHERNAAIQFIDAYC